MKTRTVLLLFVLGTGFALNAGCAAPSEPQAAQEPAAASQPAETTSTGSAPLGTEVEADHFMVTLTTDPPAPKAGRVKLVAKISHHGEPAAGATVQVTTEMPKMGHAGPSGSLRHTKDGVFEGELDLPMAGEFSVKLAIEQDGHTGSATFGFTAK